MQSRGLLCRTGFNAGAAGHVQSHFSQTHLTFPENVLHEELENCDLAGSLPALGTALGSRGCLQAQGTLPGEGGTTRQVLWPGVRRSQRQGRPPLPAPVPQARETAGHTAGGTGGKASVTR